MSVNRRIVLLRTGGNSPAALLLAGSLFLRMELKFYFYKKPGINKSAIVIFGLVRLIIILSYSR